MTDRSPFRHPTALVESDRIGARARIYAFVHVFPGATIGDDVNLNDYVLVESGVTIGDRVTVKSGVQLWDGVIVEEDVFIGPNAVFANDAYPRSRQYRTTFTPTLLSRGCTIGANATVLGGVTIGAGAMVGAAAVVTRDVPRNAIVMGNPARITGYVETDLQPSRSAVSVTSSDVVLPGGASLVDLARVEDLRGALTYAQVDGQLPFAPARIFFVYDVPNAEVRGEHAHRTLHQFLISAAGSCHAMLDDGSGSRVEVVLDRPSRGLHIPPLVWSVQYKYSAGAALLVLASAAYDANDYVRDYDEFLRLRRDLSSPP